ncbi:hypothetical protein N7492_004784 [Penicillium capsulatum]|uniref:Uncharacterized protein n=1 Tax=Penicillium capsulatum TaxID=69766 RepID=A0A9W9I8K5_9EURO|nr:hypothetical protein N7492_004784 [Penicillium capsulatum]
MFYPSEARRGASEITPVLIATIPASNLSEPGVIEPDLLENLDNAATGPKVSSLVTNIESPTSPRMVKFVKVLAHRRECLSTKEHLCAFIHGILDMLFHLGKAVGQGPMGDRVIAVSHLELLDFLDQSLGKMLTHSSRAGKRDLLNDIGLAQGEAELGRVFQGSYNIEHAPWNTGPLPDERQRIRGE